MKTLNNKQYYTAMIYLSRFIATGIITMVVYIIAYYLFNLNF